MTERPWPPHDDADGDTGSLEELRVGVRASDALAIVSVPVLLTAVFLAVGEPDRSLVLTVSEPTATSLVTAHFVHRSLAHLLDNLAAYALVVPTTYALALLSGTRREFVVAFVGLLVAAPPALSVMELLVVERGVVLGFSGLTMAFVGLLALQTGTYLESRLGAGWAGDPALALFFGGLAFAVARTASTFGARVALAGGAALVAGLYLRRSLRADRLAGAAAEGLRSVEGQFGALGLVVLAVGLVGGFPPGPEAGPVVVDTYGHLLGFAIGFLAPYLTFHVLGDASEEAHGPPEAAR